MKELTKIERFGYITQGLNLTLHARTINNEIISFDVTPEGTSGTCKGESIDLPEIIKKTDKIIDLIQLLKKSQLKLKDGQITVIPFERSQPSSHDSVANCFIDTCTAVGCGIDTGCNTRACLAHGCAIDLCQVDVIPGGCVINLFA